MKKGGQKVTREKVREVTHLVEENLKETDSATVAGGRESQEGNSWNIPEMKKVHGGNVEDADVLEGIRGAVEARKTLVASMNEDADKDELTRDLSGVIEEDMA